MEDAITQLMRETGLDFPEAVSELARRRALSRGDPPELRKPSDYIEAVIRLYRSKPKES